MPSERKRLALPHDVLGDAVHRDDFGFVRLRFVAVFEPREHQQVVDDVAHALHLIPDERDVVRLERRIQIEEPPDDGERRSQFMRDVRDEVAPHVFDAAFGRHVVRDDEGVLQVGRDHGDFIDFVASGELAEHGLVKAARIEEVAQPFVGHRFLEGLPEHRRIHAEVTLRRHVHPFDHGVVAENHDAFGQKSERLAVAHVARDDARFRAKALFEHALAEKERVKEKKSRRDGEKAKRLTPAENPPEKERHGKVKRHYDEQNAELMLEASVFTGSHQSPRQR